jgi:hypothetical protein
MVRHAEPVVDNRYVICCFSGFESCCALLIQWVETTVRMMCQWMWINVSYAEPVVVNHGVLLCASGSESLCAMLIHW